MEQFNGLHRNSARVKIPAGSWEHAQNILLQKGKGSISNEYGFDIQAPIPGNFLGSIATNEETVVFSLDNGFSCIGIIKTDNPSVYIPKIRSIYLGFKINRPIEGVFYYNFNKELLIIFSDGVFIDSNPPRLLNLSDLDLLLNPLLEFINPADVELTALFTATKEAKIDISYGNDIVLPLNIVYITYTYIQADGVSTTGYYPVQHLAYPCYQQKYEKQRSVIIDLIGLDPKFTQLQIGLIVAYEGALVGYQSPIFNYIGTTFNTTITSLGSYTTITVDELVVPTIYYTRVKSMTFQDNKLVFGNVAVDNKMDLQKYITNLELGLTYIIDDIDDQYYTHPTLCPDEVYAIYIQPQLKSSEYLDAYPLIGPTKRFVEETDLLTEADLLALGLKNATEGIAADTWKRFHVINTGEFVLPAPMDFYDPEHRELHWGYWENEETYPNSEQFNGTTSYNGTPIIGGQDVRGLPIRYFRVPGLDKIIEKLPSSLGVYDYNINPNSPLPPEDVTTKGYLPRFGVYVKNFEDAIPEEIRNQLQGFRLLIVKKKTGDTIVSDIPFIKQIHLTTQEVDGTDREFWNCTHNSPVNEPVAKYIQYGNSKVYSPTLLINKPSITSQIVKANYAVFTSVSTTTNPDGFADIAPQAGSNILNLTRFYRIRPTQKYAYLKSVTYLPENNIAANTMFCDELVILRARNYLATDSGGHTTSEPLWNPLLIDFDFDDSGNEMFIDMFNHTTLVYEEKTYGSNASSSIPADVTINRPYHFTINSSFINLYKNIHIGFNPTEFISLGKVLITNTTERLYKNGDMFTNNRLANIEPYFIGTNILGRLYFNKMHFRGLFGRMGNAMVDMIKDRNFGRFYDLDDDGSTTGFLQTLDYTSKIYNNIDFARLNDLISAISYSVNNKSVGYFPFRVARTPSIPNENLQTNILRTFRANDYYEMPNNRGEVIAVRGTNKQLFIQQKHSLFVATLKDKLSTGQTETYLGQGDIFDRTPDEIKYNTDKGYIGCTNQIAAIICPEGYVVVDQIKGNIFIIGSNFAEISKAGMTNWFERYWNTEGYYTLDRFGNKQPVDNPYNSIGHLIGYDEKFNRLLFTKKYYRFLFPNDVGILYDFDGEFYYLIEDEISTRLEFNDTNYFVEESKTLSYDIAEAKWVCEHKYFPNAYYFNTYGLFSFHKDTIEIEGGLSRVFNMYRHNSYTQKRGTYYNNITYQSYVDLIFNSRLDLSKQYQAIEWESVVEAINGVRKYNKTIDKIMVYSDYQCSGEVNVNQYNTARNTEGIWQFNEFRNIVVSESLPIIEVDGSINVNNLNINKSYFEKSFFIGTFVVVRLIMLNESDDDVYINFVNVKSRVSKR